MQVQDAIHGYIDIPLLEEEVVDTPDMQRLRRIRQLGFSQLVYPSATHSRFEHSLGALHLADRFADGLGLSGAEARRLRLAALLHDVGHGPFSHAADYIFSEEDMSHEDYSQRKIREGEIGDILRDNGVDPERVCALIRGEGWLGSLVAGHIDVDRMDYLMRDAHYTGVAYGTIDAGTIVRAARTTDGTLAFHEKYVNALESLITARYLMITAVYGHRTSRVGARMFREAFRFLREDEGLSVDELAELDEPAIIMALRDGPEPAQDLIRRIEDRELYKVAARLPEDADADAILDTVEDATGLGDGEVLIDRVRFGRDDASDVPVLTDDGTRELASISDLPEALNTTLRKRNETRVYAAPEHVADVAEATERF